MLLTALVLYLVCFAFVSCVLLITRVEDVTMTLYLVKTDIDARQDSPSLKFCAVLASKPGAPCAHADIDDSFSAAAVALICMFRIPS
ncbi:unnamed protein product [Urochloa humidicola]